MLVKIVTASSRGRSAPMGTPALIACAAARNIALPPRACTLTSCTPGIAAEASTAPATVLGMSWNFRSRKTSAQLRHLADRFGSSGCEQLAANFEHADQIRHLFGELQRCGQRVKIEGHNQAAAW